MKEVEPLERLIKDLLYNIVNQREKVYSNLVNLVNNLYPNYDLPTLEKIIDAVFEKIQ